MFKWSEGLRDWSGDGCKKGVEKAPVTMYNDTMDNMWTQYGAAVIEIGRKLLLSILIIIGGRIVTGVSRRLIQRSVKGKLKTDETLASLLSSIIKYAVIIICLIMILDIFGVNTTGLIAVLGTAGIAIGFALRDTLSNIAAGIIIIVLRPFRKGDFIECGSVSGTVKKIGLFSSVMETSDGVFVFAPNSNFWGIPLLNFSRNSKRRMDITVNISITDSIDTAFQVMNEIIREEHRFLKEPPPQAMVQSVTDTGTGITLRAWVSSDIYWRVYWDQMKNVKEKLQEAGITIASPRREIHLFQ